MFQLTKQDRFSLPRAAVLIAILVTLLGAPAQADRPSTPPVSDLITGAPAGLVSREKIIHLDGALGGEQRSVLKPASPSASSQVTTWSPLSNQGVNDSVRALAQVGSDLYVGGEFTQTDDGALTNLGHIARYNTTAGTWHALSNQGLDGDVYVLAVYGSDLYVGGSFDQCGDGSLTNLNNIARYDTTAGTWHALPNQGLNNSVLALALAGSNLYAGGYFTETDDELLTDLGCVARYDITARSWHALPNQGLDGGSPPIPGLPPIPRVYAMVVSDGNLYVGGDFHRTGDASLTNLGHIARYDTAANTWHALPNQGLDNQVFAMAVSDDDLYVGGNFAETGDQSLSSLGSLARYDTISGSWQALSNQGLDNKVYALAVSNGDLYTGGLFSETGDGSLADLGYIARYDILGGTWHALPNQGLNDSVRALAQVGSDLYVGGFFSQTGDGSLSNLGCIVRGSSAATEAEIQVLDGATDIPDGTGSVNFGITTVDTPINKTFTVRNAGTADLTLTEPISVPTGFSVANSFGLSLLAPSKTTTFTIQLDAVAAGTYSGTLEFINNDGDESPFNFAISGSVYYDVYLPLVNG
jgi:N-acetylneuraminic acid mutarotase